MRSINYKLSIIVSGILILFSCELNRLPETDLSDAGFWKNANDFEQGVNYLYTLYLPSAGATTNYPLATDQMSDNAMGLDLNEISNGSFLPDANFGPWDGDYTLIRNANNILEKAEASGELKETLTQYIAEARFFRAWGYFELVSRYGDVPLITKTLDINDPELYAARTPRSEVIEFIYDDLDYAADNLPDKSESLDNDAYGRITSGAAMAFKSRVALREGTWIKFHGAGGNANTHLNIAMESALDVMQSGTYSLFNDFGTDSYEMLFKNPGQGPDNDEAIMVNRFDVDFDNNIASSQYTQQLTRGFYAPTRSLVDAYLCTDGLPIDQSPLYQGQVNANSEFIDRDPRLDAIIVQKGEQYLLEAASTDYAPDPYQPTIASATGYRVEKYVDVNGYFLDHIIMRYGEVLLNYAEAVYELNDAISDADLDLSINLLRDRVGMPDLTNAFVTGNGLNMRDEIRRERRIELAMEGARYDDLLRWKIAETELPKALEGVRFFNAEYVNTDVTSLVLTTDSVLVGEAASQRSFDPSKQYLWPIPLNQISINQNLEQNPNW